MKEIGVYIHIPFCKQKCYYCDFCSFVRNERIQKEYISCLLSEIENYKVKLKKLPHEWREEKLIIKTIYIGGGTPSIINSKYIVDIIEKIKEQFIVDKNAEITIEANPGTITEEKIRNYYDAGVNRISMGLQTTNDKLLKVIGRIHNFNEFERAYELAKKIGFSNINVDLMIGLPTQTITDVEQSLNQIIKKQPKHISVYSLILEEDTILEKKVNSGELVLPNEDEERAMYWKVKNVLEKNGFYQYEISNFSLKGYESKHNTDCWNQKEYLGFGLAAHSYYNDVRFSNLCSLDDYIENIKREDFCSNITIHEVQEIKDKMNEYVILKLRTMQGIKFEEFTSLFGISFMEKYKLEVERLQRQGLIKINNIGLKLSTKGIDFANVVWSEFV